MNWTQSKIEIYLYVDRNKTVLKRYSKALKKKKKSDMTRMLKTMIILLNSIAITLVKVDLGKVQTVRKILTKLTMALIMAPIIAAKEIRQSLTKT